MLPSAIVGSEVIDQNPGDFRIHRGPIFTNLLLADEINRAAPKVQGAFGERNIYLWTIGTPAPK